LEYLEHSFRGPGFLKLGKAVGDPREESFAGAGALENIFTDKYLSEELKG